MIPQGVCEVVFPEYGDAITWCKPTTTVHNMILGKVWVDQEGEVIVKNHKTGERCQMTWAPYSDVGKHFTVLIGLYVRICGDG